MQYFLKLGKERFSASEEASGLESSNFLFNMLPYIGILLAFVAFMVVYFIISRFQEKLKAKFRETLNKVFFNAIIESFSITYLKIGVVLGTNLRNTDFNKPLKDII